MSRATSIPSTGRSASSALRSRWAALGAAVAVTIGVGGVGLVEATVSEGERPVLVQIEPCRLVDTRAASDIGPRHTPIGTAESYDVAAHGINGNCDIPTGASGLSLNVTAIGATATTNVRVFPSDATLPLTSNLNPSPGETPVPNSVTTGLDDDGMFTLYNEFGSVDLIVDVNGYYEDHNHDDRYVRQNDVIWAVVDSDGTLDRGSEGVTSELIETAGVGTPDYYRVAFSQQINDCAFQATTGATGLTTNLPAGSAQVGNSAFNVVNSVLVFVHDNDGNRVTNRDFHLTVTC